MQEQQEMFYQFSIRLADHNNSCFLKRVMSFELFLIALITKHFFKLYKKTSCYLFYFYL